MRHGGSFVIFVVVFAVIVMVGVALGMAFRPRVQRQLYSGTGIERWRSTASGLTWADRWTLSWANSWGRAVPRRLAGLAVERGEVMLAMTERMLDRRSKAHRFWLWMGAVWAVLGLLNIGNLILGDGGWLNVVPPVLGLITVFLLVGPGQVWQAGLIRRSVELNRRQLEVGSKVKRDDGP